MRKLMWFTIGFSIACAIGVYFASGQWLLLSGLFCFLALCLLKRIPVITRKRILYAIMGSAVGLSWLWCFDGFYLSPARQLDDKTTHLEIAVTEYSTPTDRGVKSEGRIYLKGVPYTVQFYINESVDLSPGDVVAGGFSLDYTGSGEDKPAYHQGKGIFLIAYPKGTYKISPCETPTAGHFPTILRQEIMGLLDKVFPTDTAGFARALLLGDTSRLSFDAKNNLKSSGVYHIVAVSGMHVSILFSLVLLLCGRRRFLVALLGLPTLLLFAAVAGFSPSIVRACIMQALMILALLINKEYDPPTALAVAVLVILASNPLSITSVSLQLSAGCVIGIFLFTKPIHDYLLNETPLGPAKGKSFRSRLIRWLVGSVSVTLGAMITTTPLCAVYFGCVSISGILTNLLILWVINFIFYGVLIACVLGVIWLPLGIGVGLLVSFPIRLVLGVTNMISRLPVSAVYTASIYIVAWLIFAYVILLIFLKSKKKRPLILVCCLLLGLFGALGCSYLEHRIDNYRITAIDVGQGQCLLLQYKGEYYMVDCGGDDEETAATRAMQLLLSQGIFRLDGIILTHYDTDHAGCADKLLSRIPADRIYLPVLAEESVLRDTLAAKYSDKICWVEEKLRIESANITIYPSEDREDDNESSLCILFQPENCDILITGDRSTEGEMDLLESEDIPDLEILVAGHHGSKNATSWELLNQTRPEIVIISVGADNRYGHPSWETLERLNLFGCQVYRTDLEGTIIFRG